MSSHEKLIAAAKSAQSRAYAPYSKFFVGAAIEGEDGEIYQGCNIENCSYGLTICAERVAAGNARVHSPQRWKRIAIVSAGGVAPCGACRQFLLEFEPNLELILVDADSEKPTRTVTLSALLPESFSPANLTKH